jgi:hypothetical protein
MYDEGLSRSLYFNAHALPALAHYRTVEWLHREASDDEQKRVLQPLHERCARASVACCGVPHMQHCVRSVCKQRNTHGTAANSILAADSCGGLNAGAACVRLP